MVFAEMTSKFKAIGYQEGINLFGAPYDWRKPMNTLLNDKGDFADLFFTLVNDAYTKSGNASVHIVTHSYGGLNVLNFMNRYKPANMTPAAFQSWITTHIASFIPIAGPFSGTAKSLRAVLSGDTFGAPSFLINIDTVANLVREWGGAINLIPDVGFWPANFTFVRTPSANYSASEQDLVALFNAVGAAKSAAIFQTTKDSINDLTIPHVPTYCLYGYDHPTEISYTYDAGLNSKAYNQPTHIDVSDLGDGVVPLASLLECQYWHEHEGPKDHIRCREYDIRGHEDLQDEHMISDILAICTGSPNVIATCETKNLDASMAALGDNKPAKAKAVERARLANRAKKNL